MLVQSSRGINIETLTILGILFGFYVVGDLFSTMWLIANYPGGIQGESNPLGLVIYNGQGIAGIIATKLVAFIAISVTAIILEFHYKHEKRVMAVVNFTILALMAWSLIVVTANVMLIYELSLNNNTYESVFLHQTYFVILAVIIGLLILLPRVWSESLGTVEIILAVTIIAGPLALSPGLYQHLLMEGNHTLFTYITAIVGIVGLIIYSMRRLYKRIIPEMFKIIE